MSQKYRVPRNEPEFNEWLQTFALNFASVANELDEEECVARIENDAAANNYMILRYEAVKVYVADESKAKQRVQKGKSDGGIVPLPVLNLPALPEGIVPNEGVEEYASDLVQRIVKRDACTPEIEAQLGIELKGGEEPDNLTGEIKSAESRNGGEVLLKCAMQGFKSYRVFSMRGDEADFVNIGDSMQSEFTDDRPNLVNGQPEKRQYKIIMREKNQPVGDYSDVKMVVTKP